MKKLCEIINCEYDTLITGIETDSRYVKEGNLFVAVKGFFTNHEDFIPMAIENGASAVVCESDLELEVPCIKVDDVNSELYNILKKYYDNVQDNFKFIGVTGTDGKTTTATIISDILDCGYIGTNGVVYKDYYENATITTPEICELYRILTRLKDKGCKTLVMEVSSEALLHDRVKDIKYDIACFTNITEDHLNIHKTKENYVNSKIKLFTLVKDNGFSILNRDDENYHNVEKNSNGEIISYGIDSNSDFKISNIVNNNGKTSFDLYNDNKIYHINSKLPFIYNTYNLSLAFIVCMKYGMNIDEIINKISMIDNIPGRCEILDFGQNYTIMLDYAHTFNSIKKLVDEVNKENYNKVIVVTGAAGGREKEKRKLIGSYLLDNTDLTIFTMDDPRYESVDSITDDLIGDSTKTNYLRINNREDAIKKAFDIAEESDIVLVIGKGRDNYMAIEDKKLPYCDYDVIKNYFD